MENSGIYQIKNLINNKVYIGKSKCLKQRLSVHLSDLKNNKHHSFHLQRSVNKYGIENFQYSILKYCNEELLDIQEAVFITKYNSTDRLNGYNILQSKELSKQQSKNAIIRNLKFGNLDKARLKFVEKYSIKVFQFDLTGKYINEYKSIAEAGRVLNIDPSSITKCCKNKINLIKGFVFSYTKNFNPKTDKNKTKIVIFDSILNTKIIYPSISNFCKKYNIKDTSVIHAALTKRNGKYKQFLIEKI